MSKTMKFRDIPFGGHFFDTDGDLCIKLPEVSDTDDDYLCFCLNDGGVFCDESDSDREVEYIGLPTPVTTTTIVMEFVR